MGTPNESFAASTAASQISGFTFDAAGRLTSGSRAPTGARPLGWDPAGQLTSYADGSESASFQNHPFGRRIEATVNGQTTYYLYGTRDGGHPIAEYAGGGWYREAIMEGVRGGWLCQNGDGRFTLPDALGSTAVLAQDGTVQASRLYPFGWRQPPRPPLKIQPAEIEGETGEIPQGGSVLGNDARAGREASRARPQAGRGGRNTRMYPIRPDQPRTKPCEAYRPARHEEAQATSAEYQWTNQIRDANALDHFAFRTYSSNLARWLSPDPAGLAAVDPAEPASWNRYAYVANQPLSAVDPLGLCGYSVSWSDTFGNGGGSTGDDGLPCETVTGGGGDGGHPRALSDAKPDHPDPGGRCILCGPWYVPPGPPPSFRQALDCIKSGTDAFNLQTGLEAISGGHLGTSNFAGALLGSSVSSAISFGQDLATGRLGDSLKVAAGESFADFGLGIALRRVPDLTLNLGATLVGLADTESGPALVTASTSVSIVVPVGSAASATANFLDLAEFLGKAPVDLTVAAFSVIGCAAIQ